MKQFRSSLFLLLVAAVVGGYIWFNERGPAPTEGQKELLRFRPGEVSNLKLDKNGNGVAFQLKEKEWQVAALKNGKAGVFVPADADILQPLLDATQVVQSNATVEKPEKLKEYGLDKPSSRLQINDKAVEFGTKPKFDTTRIYAKIGDTIALVPATLADFASKKWDDWRDKAVLHFDSATATRFSLQTPLVNASFAKTGDDWSLEKPVAAPADKETIDNFLGSISSTRAVQWLDETPSDLKKWGLDKPVARFEVGDAWLKIGKTVKNGYAAQNNSSPSIFRLGLPSFMAMNQPLTSWRDKRVVQFDLAKIARMSLTQNGQTQNFVKDGEKWAVDGQKSDEKTNDAILQIIVAVHDWHAQDFIDKTSDLKSFGLDKPLWELGGDIMLRVGQKGVKIYAQSGQNSGGTIFVLSPDVLNTVKEAFANLKPNLKVAGGKAKS